MSNYHTTRLAYNSDREVLWKTLCDSYFNKLITPEDCVLELGAGHGHFINNVRCRQKIAIDQWEGLATFVKPQTTVITGSVTDLSAIEDGSVDFAFASNLFEHLTQGDFALVLDQLRRKLSSRGSLNILQPNYRLAYRRYFDDYTHISVYSEVSLGDFLAVHGYRVTQCEPGFLPLTVKSRLPVSPWLIRLYLSLPFKPLAGQMFLRAVPQM